MAARMKKAVVSKKTKQYEALAAATNKAVSTSRSGLARKLKNTKAKNPGVDRVDKLRKIVKFPKASVKVKLQESELRRDIELQEAAIKNGNDSQAQLAYIEMLRDQLNLLYPQKQTTEEKRVQDLRYMLTLNSLREGTIKNINAIIADYENKKIKVVQDKCYYYYDGVLLTAKPVPVDDPASWIFKAQKKIAAPQTDRNYQELAYAEIAHDPWETAHAAQTMTLRRVNPASKFFPFQVRLRACRNHWKHATNTSYVAPVVDRPFIDDTGASLPTIYRTNDCPPLDVDCQYPFWGGQLALTTCNGVSTSYILWLDYNITKTVNGVMSELLPRFRTAQFSVFMGLMDTNYNAGVRLGGPLLREALYVGSAPEWLDAGAWYVSTGKTAFLGSFPTATGGA